MKAYVTNYFPLYSQQMLHQETYIKISQLVLELSRDSRRISCAELSENLQNLQKRHVGL
jgi:hypothetical protein